MECFYWCDFMNIIFGYCSCYLLGMLSYKKVFNLGLFNSIIYVGVMFFYLGFIMCLLIVFWQIYYNIKVQGYFIFNQVIEEMMYQVYQVFVKYELDYFEFEVVGLKIQYIDIYFVFYVVESLIKLGFELVEEYYIKVNGFIFVIGKVVEVVIDEVLIVEDGYILLEKVGIFSVVGLDSYYKFILIDWLDYLRL